MVAWLLIQAASIFLPAFECAALGDASCLSSFLSLGFPVALVFSWAFEITPEGINLESDDRADKSITRHTGRKIVAVTIVLAVVATGLF